MNTDTEDGVWEDREIKFDIGNIHQRDLRRGERILDHMNYIEDTKGNPNDEGRLLITNLRLIWYSLAQSKFNLSIGYACILTLTTKTVLSKLNGTTQALYCLTVNNNTRFEFIFTNLSVHSGRQFTAVFDVFRLYQKTYLYRELKLRSSIIQSKQLLILPHEIVYSTLGGVWNLSSDQGNLGSFVITNVRLVWFANINESFNISLPYMQISTINIRNSKYGLALVIQTSTNNKNVGYVLGFRIDPVERLNGVYNELKSLYEIYSVEPNFGIYYEPTNIVSGTEDHKYQRIIMDDIQELVDDTKSTAHDTNFASYLASSSDGSNREPIYCKELGFAMEKNRDGYTLKDLWTVVPY